MRARKDDMRLPYGMVQLTRAQWKTFRNLRTQEMLWATRIHRTTINALVYANLAYETDTGQLRLSGPGKRAELLFGYTVRKLAQDMY